MLEGGLKSVFRLRLGNQVGVKVKGKVQPKG